jgi:uncharacterized membrane protein YbhN (UPF0104 family)
VSFPIPASVRSNPLRAATLACSCWAFGVLLATGLGLAFGASRGWHGVVAPADLVPAAACAAASFLFRFLRWHLLARRVAPALGLGASFAMGTIGFALTMTPGRAGEALKLLLLRQRTAVPIATSAPVLLLEKVSEGTGFALLALGASFFLPWTEAFRTGADVAVIAPIVALALAATFRRRITALAPGLPLVGRLLARPGLQKLWADLAHGGDRVLGWPGLLLALGLSLLARAFDGLVIFWIARLYGLDLPLAAAWFIIGSAGFVGGVSMLPGGAGAVEATMIGLLLAFGGEPAAAAATALTARVLILWLWVLLGLGLALRYSTGAGGRGLGAGARRGPAPIHLSAPNPQPPTPNPR